VAETGGLEQELMDHFRQELRIAPELEWVPSESLPREMKKTQYIEVQGGA
jgi:hypothetical protein